MSFDEIQATISRLSAEELDHLPLWFDDFLADRWVRRIEADILASRLDPAGRRADEDSDFGRCMPLI